MSTVRWEVGPEHDNQLFQRLGDALRESGFDLASKWDAVAGSQDISHWKVSCTDGSLVVEAETYIGLSVEGPSQLIDRVRNQFEASQP